MKDDAGIVIVVALIVVGVLGLIGGIVYFSDRNAQRDKEFAIECLEAGGTILYSQCVTGVEPRG